MGDIRQSGSYARVVKLRPKSWMRRPFELWERLWYFERLLALLLVIALPLIACQMWEAIVSQTELKIEADKLAGSLRMIKSRARDSNAFVYVVGVTSGLGANSFWVSKSSKSEPKQEQVALPKGISVTGQVVFDPLGVPDAPSEFTLRRGFQTEIVHVDSQGFVRRQ